MHSKYNQNHHHNFDFIIPFLINDYNHARLEKSKQKHTHIVSQTANVQATLNNHANIIKVYNVKK